MHGMNLSDQKVYLGRKLMRRTVWNLHRDSIGHAFGFITVAGRKFKVWDVNGIWFAGESYPTD